MAAKFACNSNWRVADAETSGRRWGGFDKWVTLPQGRVLHHRTEIRNTLAVPSNELDSQ